MIAISYRREDTAPITGRIYDRLEALFGRDRVFMDLDSIFFGVDFRTHISESLNRCDTLLVVIGPRWFGVSADGSRRIDDPTDFVRLEVSQALARDIRVIPLLIDKTEMPSSTVLPDDMKKLAFRNALRVDSGADFRHHMDRLCRSLGMTAEAPAKRVMTPVAPSVDSSVKKGQQDSVATAKDMAIPTPLTRPPFSRKSIFILVAIVILTIVPIAILMIVGGAGWYLGHTRISANRSENRNISPSLPEDMAVGAIVKVNEVDGRKCRTNPYGEGRDLLDVRSGPGDSFRLVTQLRAGETLLRERDTKLSDKEGLGGLALWVRVFELNGKDGDSATAKFIGWAESRFLRDDFR